MKKLPDIKKFIRQLFCKHYSEVSDSVQSFSLNGEGDLKMVVHNRTCVKCSKKYQIVFDWT